MFVLFGTEEHNTIAFRGVERIYISIAPKDDKMKYIKHDRIRDEGIVITPLSKLREDENVKCVYVVEFFDKSEPMILPTDKFIINFINEKGLF
jgi:hypothetical protein